MSTGMTEVVATASFINKLLRTPDPGAQSPGQVDNMFWKQKMFGKQLKLLFDLNYPKVSNSKSSNIRKLMFNFFCFLGEKKEQFRLKQVCIWCRKQKVIKSKPFCCFFELRSFVFRYSYLIFYKIHSLMWH